MSLTFADIKKILPLLQSAKVHKFKLAELEIVFQELKTFPEISPPQSSAPPSLIQTPAVDEVSLPVDLRTDNINSVDNILNWSASPGHSEQEELPGTGDIQMDV